MAIKHNSQKSDRNMFGAVAPLSEFDRALRAIVKVPKSDVLKAERQAKRKPMASKRKRK